MDPAAYFAAAESAFAAAADRSALRSFRVGIAGRSIRLDFAGPALADAIMPVFAHLIDDASGGAVRATDLVLRVWDRGETDVSLPPRPWPPEREGVQGRAELGAGYAALVDGGGVQIWLLDRTGGRGIVWYRAAADMPYWERIHPLRQFFEAWASALDLQMMHAGAIAFGDAPGALFVGKGGSGKSTTVLACLEAGARTVGDDYVLVDTGGPGGNPVAHSLYGTMRLFESHVRRFPSLMPDHDSVAPGHDGAPKLTAYVSRRRPERFAESLPIAAVMMPRVAGGTASRAVRESGGAALFALAPNSLKQLDPTSRAAFQRMALLCKSVPCWRLELGTDLAGIAPAVRDAIARSL